MAKPLTHRPNEGAFSVTEQIVTSTIAVEEFRKSFLMLWNEIFVPVGDGPHWVLDAGTSLFETLSDITAEEASIPVSKQSSNLAAQVNHTSYYIEELREGIATNFQNKPDWDGSWQVGAVDDAQWQALVDKLRANYDWFTQLATENDIWNEDYIGGAMAMIVHAAYHLGEIRQGIGVIRGR
jgi:hypothetical protein